MIHNLFNWASACHQLPLSLGGLLSSSHSNRMNHSVTKNQVRSFFLFGTLEPGTTRANLVVF